MYKDLRHEGTKRHSGRYPWGSGEQPFQSEAGMSFLSYVDRLKKEGMSEVEIAKSLKITVQKLREQNSYFKDEKRAADSAMVLRLKDKGWSNVAIGKRMGINESSVRALLDPAKQERAIITKNVINALKDNLTENNYLDVGLGVEAHLGISRTKLLTAISSLKEEGYVVSYIKVPQLGTDKYTSVMVLSKPGTEYKEVYANRTKIEMPGVYSTDGGRVMNKVEPHKSLDSSRLAINYNSERDGVIELRRGVDDISLGNSKYAQVRIAVDGTRYLKGMAMYSDDLPDGVDVRFNTNKSSNLSKMEVLKPLAVDSARPFGTIPRQKHYIDANGEKQLSLLNIVNEEGDWTKWTKSLASQMVSKQTPAFAKKQLEKAFQLKKEEYDEILELTNPAVKQILLKPFSDGADSAAVNLKAAGLPRQAWSVILPFKSIKEDQIYAPNNRDGETVVLIRYPHGGIFEIPELTVNNKNPEAKKTLGQARDAIGINPKVAEKLSGADFDGDTVIVIPSANKGIKTAPALQGLKNFDPKTMYKQFPGMVVIKEKRMQTLMGDVSNLITDMTIQGAEPEEIAKAVRHSMVVIDSYNHKLNYKQSEIDNGIPALKKKYQGKTTSGASTLLSKSTSDAYVDHRKEGIKTIDPVTGKEKRIYIDPKTGKKLYEKTGETYVNKEGKIIERKSKSKKMLEEDDAFNLSSGTVMESVYATHANKLKQLANQARLALLNTKPRPYSPSARKTYAEEVKSLLAKLNVAIRNKPLERQAQLLANAMVKAAKDADSELSGADLKKIKGQALEEARKQVGAGKEKIEITTKEWEAIQSGAVTHTTQLSILSNSDLDKVKALATPRKETPKISGARLARARTMLNAGHTQAEVAAALGMSLTTIQEILN